MATGKGRDVSLYDGKIRKLDLVVNIHILVLVYAVEYRQRGQPLLAHSASRGVFSPFMPLKLPSAAQVDISVSTIPVVLTGFELSY